MLNEPEFNPFICQSDKAVKALPYWLRRIESFNDFFEDEDRRRKPIIKLGWDTRPGSDLGEWRHVYVIMCDTRERCAVALDLVDAEIKRRASEPADEAEDPRRSRRHVESKPRPVEETDDQPDVDSWF